MTDEEKQRAVSKALGEPFAVEFQENAFKVRRSLLLFSFVSLVVTLGGVQVGDSISVFGLTLRHFSTELFLSGLLVAMLYHQVHFGWYCIDSFAEWRLHVTGTKLAFPTGFVWDHPEKDKAPNPRQSTLYAWWLEQTEQLEKNSASLNDALKKLNELDAALKSPEMTEGESKPNFSNLLNLIRQAQQDITKHAKSIETIEKTIGSARIPVSLGRFDNFFHIAKRSSNLRWLLIEMCAPLILGVMAIASLVMRVCP